jgi:endonuclease YncB( thermonuclease family)
MATVEEQADSKVALLNSNIWQLGLIVRDRVQWLSDYHQNPIDFYNAAFAKLGAVEAQLSEFEEFLEAYGGELNMAYYGGEMEAFKLQVQGFRSILPVPRITNEIAKSEQLVGKITAIDDGDTVFIEGVECRLAKINAAEIGNARGVVAKEIMENLVPVGTPVTLKIDPHSPIEVYGRALGVLFRDSDGLNVNLEMVKRCAAEVDTKYPRHKYVDDEEYKQAGEKCSLTFPNFGILKAYTDPTHAMIFIDGEDIRQITPAEIPLPIGTHHIELVKTDYVSHHEDVPVQLGMNVVNRKLVKMPASEGLLAIKTVPDGLQVVLDGLPAGLSPVYTTVTSEKPHSIEAIGQDGKKDSGMVSVVPGKTTTVVLEPK